MALEIPPLHHALKPFPLAGPAHVHQLARHEMLGQKRAIVFGKVGHRFKIAHAPVIDPLPDLAHAHLGLTLGRAGKLEGHFDGAAVEQALDPCPGVQAQVIVDLGFGQYRVDQLDIQAARRVVIALDKTVGRELFVAGNPPGFGQRGGAEGKQQAEH